MRIANCYLRMEMWMGPSIMEISILIQVYSRKKKRDSIDSTLTVTINMTTEIQQASNKYKIFAII